MIDSIFVYGTLKQGHLRSTKWPRKPLAIRPATIVAELYDTGPFPAILQGNDRVLGEVWTIAAEDMPITLRALDEVEGYDAARENNLYKRIVTEATFGDGTRQEVFVYRFAVEKPLASMRRILPATEFAGQLSAVWPDPLARVPRSFEEE